MFRGQQPAGPAGDTSSVGEMLDELNWPSLEALTDWSSLLLFHKIHSGAVSMEKDKYPTPVHSLKSTRASHSAQYCTFVDTRPGDKNISILHLSCRTSDLQYSLVLQTHALVL